MTHDDSNHSELRTQHRQQVRRWGATLVAMAVAVALTSCSSTPAQTTPVATKTATSTTSTTSTTSVAPEVTTAPVETVPISWDGTWTDILLTAQITNGTIRIRMPGIKGNDLYWQGTWPTATTVADGAKIVSKVDAKAMVGTLVGSKASTLTLTYVNNELTFMLPTSAAPMAIHLKK